MVDIHIYNDKKLITNFIENSTKVKRLTSNNILPSRKMVKIKLVLKDELEKLVFMLINIFYFFYNLWNLISLGFLNNAEIYYYNKD